MLFIRVEDFFAQARAVPRFTQEEEKVLAERMANGDQTAREQLIRSYYPLVAAVIGRSPKEIQTLHTVYACIQELENGVDRFNFLQDNETFIHHISWRLRQAITRAIADR